jgi:hypothetical protein
MVVAYSDQRPRRPRGAPSVAPRTFVVSGTATRERTRCKCLRGPAQQLAELFKQVCVNYDVSLLQLTSWA